MSPKCSEYERTLRALYSSLPLFQRIGPAAYKKNLNNITALCEALGNPYQRFHSIHIGGTNGKGSSAHLVAAILQCAGYKTGLCTSPHLQRFTERIKINGQEISHQFVVSFVKRVTAQIDALKPSFFELTTAMALDYFAYENVDFAVVEVGLGGRLDSTNIITPRVSLITHIGYDHEDLLGSTLPLIAKEKAGIMKSGITTVISENQPEVKDVFLKQEKAVGARVQFAQDHYAIEEDPKAETGMLSVSRGKEPLYRFIPGLSGACQRKNIVGVLHVVDELRRQNVNIPASAVEEGIAHVITLTGLKGRWQQLADSPAIYCDVAHNQSGMAEVLKEIERRHYKKLRVVLGTVKDKKIAPLLSLLPTTATYYFCQAKIPRAMPADELQKIAQEVGLQGVVIPDVNAAIGQAQAQADSADLIFIGGSTFVVAEINEL